MAALLTPPVLWAVAITATILPSRLAPILMWAVALGRLPADVCSCSRSRNILTGRPPAIFDSRAAVTPQMSALNFEPKPPPM